MVNYQEMKTPDLLQTYANFFRVHRNRVSEHDSRYLKLYRAVKSRVATREMTEIIIAQGHMDADQCNALEFDDVISSLKIRYANS